MKITRISVFQVDLPLEHPYWLSGGRLKFEVLDATFVKIETDAGIIGWGEGTPWGHTYVPAHGPGIRAGIETMAPFIMGLDPRKVLGCGTCHGPRTARASLCKISYRHGLLGYCRKSCRAAHCRSDGRRLHERPARLPRQLARRLSTKPAR